MMDININISPSEGFDLKAYCEIAAAIATTLGIPIAVYQLWQSRKERTTAFEDSFAKEYRDLAATIPTKAFLGGPGVKGDFSLTEEEYQKCFDELYHYIDLSNTQTFLYEEKRISEKTWVYWKAGIASNLNLPTFKRAWSEIAHDAPSNFAELRRLFPPVSLDERPPLRDSNPPPPDGNAPKPPPPPADESPSAVSVSEPDPVPRKPAPGQSTEPLPKPSVGFASLPTNQIFLRTKL